MSKEDNETIHFVITGGTIDAFYNGIKDTVDTLPKSSIPEYIKSLKLYVGAEFTEVCMKDSRELSINDRKKVLDTIEKSPHTRIIVTHGTYTMPDTARFLEANLKRKDQVVIFTGSMIPLIGFSPSDAPFSLGFAVSQTSELEPGIYVCMNGRVFVSGEIVKLLNEGKFGSIFEK